MSLYQTPITFSLLFPQAEQSIIVECARRLRRLESDCAADEFIDAALAADGLADLLDLIGQIFPVRMSIATAARVYGTSTCERGFK
jgi:hypothetical protein